MKGLTVKAVLILWLASSVIVLYLLKNIEWTLVYGAFLKEYGLRWSAGWAVPYGTYMYTIYFLIGVPMALSAGVLIHGFWTGRKHAPLKERKAESAVTETIKESVLISCPNCKKVFSKPLQMVEFDSEDPSFVNICPYCYSRLDGGKAKQDKGENIRVLKPERSITRKRK